MSSDFDATEFIDGDFEARHSPSAGSAGPATRAPSREEVDAKVVEAHQKLSELKRAQEELERERAGLEETRRRQMEFQTGRQEMVQNLARGLGLLEEAEFGARRDAEQMGKALTDLELTRALTTLENARMEWNASRLKFPVLSGQAQPSTTPAPAQALPPASVFETHSFGEMCRLGFALTWPVALTLLGLGGLLVALFRR